MGKIKKILENELLGGTTSNDVYPITSTQAVYTSENTKLSDSYVKDVSCESNEKDTSLILKSESDTTINTITIPAATTETAGVMSAKDKVHIDNVTETVDAVFIVEASKNLLNPNDKDVMLGYFQAGASPIANASYNLSGFIKIEAEKTYHIGRGGSSPLEDWKARYVAFFDVEKKYISSISYVADITIPDGAVYMRISLDSKYSLEYAMVEEGTTYSGYIPYGNSYRIADDVEIDIKDSIGTSGSSHNQTADITITKTSLYSWKSFEVAAKVGDIIEVVIITDTEPSRLIAYENTAGSNAHELSAKNDMTTEFACKTDCHKIYIYGLATVIGNATIGITVYKEGAGILGRIEKLETIFEGKKFAFLGSSITQGKAWCSKVARFFGSKDNYVNCGVGGSAIVNEGDSSLSNPKRLTGEYSNVTDPNTGEVTVSGVALPLDSEVIIIEGGVNDWARNWPLGNRKIVHTDGVLSVDDKTFYGACHQMFHNIIARCPNATIIVVGDVFGKMPNRSVFTDKYGLYNNQDLMITDYADALVDVAGMWGFRAFNFGRYVGVNDSNVLQMGDGLHPNSDHNTRIANAVCNFMMQVHNAEI